ncbi:MAG: thioredoxin family protein [Thermodesulfobacteriota bacterium]
MRKNFISFHMVIFIVVLVSSISAAPVPGEPVVPVKDTVTMVDLGAKTCIPCKLMAPILEELKEEYDGRAAVIFIDVWEDRSQGKRFAISSIPTQIFYDKHGNEVYRHKGFYSKKDIKKWLDILIERK